MAIYSSTTVLSVRLPPRKANTAQHADARQGEEVDPADITPVDGVPAPVVQKGSGEAQRQDRVQVADVSDEQDGDEGGPHALLGGDAQDQSFCQGKTQVQVRQLSQHDGC